MAFYGVLNEVQVDRLSPQKCFEGTFLTLLWDWHSDKPQDNCSLDRGLIEGVRGKKP